MVDPIKYDEYGYKMKSDEQTQLNAKYFTRLDSGEWVFHYTPFIKPFTLLFTTEEQKDHMLRKWNEFQAPHHSSKEQESSLWDSYILEILFMPISATFFYYATPLNTMIFICFIQLFFVFIIKRSPQIIGIHSLVMRHCNNIRTGHRI